MQAGFLAGPAPRGLVFIMCRSNSLSHGTLHWFSFWLLEMYVLFSNVFVPVAVRKLKDQSLVFYFVLFVLSMVYMGPVYGSAKGLAIKSDDLG